jgi:hypothetical protein
VLVKGLSMKRLVGFILGVIALWIPQARGQDVIRYLDGKTMKEANATGAIQEETPGHISYQPAAAAGSKEILASDVVDVTYETPAALRLIYRRAPTQPRKIPSV